MWRCRRSQLWLLPLLRREPPPAATSSPLPCRLLQRFPFVNAKTKRKKDASLDGIEVINRSSDIRVVSSLTNIMMAAPAPAHAIPVSAVSKMDRVLEIPTKVATFLRRYPSFFEEFVGPQHNLPWFRPTEETLALHGEEQRVFELRRAEIVDGVRRLILMSREKRLPIRILQGMQWYLGVPADFTKRAEEYSAGRLRVVEMGDGLQGLAPVDCGGRVLSALQRNAMKGSQQAEPPSVIEFPLFLSKGVRLKQKVIHWLGEFQKLPYVSPYEDSSGLNPNSRVAEKRLAGVLHELLSLFVDNSAERRKVLCLRKHLGLPQRFYKAFEHHPHIFYLLLKNKTCTVVLKEAYCAGAASAIEKHPVLDVRKKYVELMKKSEIILRERRSRRPAVRSSEDSTENDEDGCVDCNGDGGFRMHDSEDDALEC